MARESRSSWAVWHESRYNAAEDREKSRQITWQRNRIGNTQEKRLRARRNARKSTPPVPLLRTIPMSSAHCGSGPALLTRCQSIHRPAGEFDRFVVRGAVLFPPGWSLDVSGPHVALPLLRGFASTRGIDLTTYDLNAAIAAAYGAMVTQTAAVEAVAIGTLDAMNEPWFQAQRLLDSAADGFGGRWSIRNGYEPHGYSNRSSESVRRAATQDLPYTAFLRRNVLPELLEFDVIGLSVAVPGQFLGAFHLATLLRRAGYGGKLLLGGNAITRLGQDLARDWVFDLVDGVVLFGGELALVATLSAQTAWPAAIPNLMWRSGDEIVTNEIRHLRPGEFVAPAYDSVRLDSYWGVPHLPALGFRGCYYGKCPFCAIPYGWGANGMLGMESPGGVLASLRTASELTGVSRFKFVDEAMHPQFLRAFVNLFQCAAPEIEFEAYARLDPFLVDSRLMAKAARAGLRKLYIGLELAPTTNRATLMKSDLSNITEVLRLLSSLGVKAHLFCMFGYPGTTTDDALRTMEFLFKNRQSIDTVDIAEFRLERHTSVPNVIPLTSDDEDWALSYSYESANGAAMAEPEVAALCDDMQDLVWREQPTWFHPIYRVMSPWSTAGSLVPESIALEAELTS